MKCNKTNNIKKGYNRYCSFIKHMGFKDDTVFGVYLGCFCKQHDIRYSNEGTVSRRTADDILRLEVEREFKRKGKKRLGKMVAYLMWISVRMGGMFVWKTWSSKGVDRYQ